MKYILSILLLICFTASVQAEVPYRGPNVVVNRAQKSILERAKKDNKDVLLVFHADWCGWCKRLDKDTLRHDDVRKVLSKYLVYRIDVDRYRRLIKVYKVGPVPAYILISKEGKILKRGEGYRSPQEFLEFLQKRG